MLHRGLRHCIFVCLFAIAPQLSFGAEGGPDPAKAEVLFREGRDAASQGNHILARDKFDESFRLDPAAGSALNLALEEEQLGDLVASWGHTQRALELLASSDERRAIGVKLLKRLTERIPRIRLVVTVPLPEDVEITRDGTAVPPTDWNTEVPVNPGHHVIVVRAKGHFDRTIDVTVSERARLIVPLLIGDARPLPPPPPVRVDTRALPPAGQVPLVDDSRATLRTWAWVSVGAAGVGLVTSLGFGGLALGKKGVTDGECTVEGCSDVGLAASRDGRAYATVATVAGVSTLAFAATSAILFVMSKPSHRVAVVPLVNPSTFGANVAFRF